MGVNKRYLYVSEESMAAQKNDYLREAIGSYWYIKSSKAANTNQIRFGAKVPERLFNIEYGPVMLTEGATAPYSAKHQIIKLTANPKKFGVYPECLQCGWTELTKNIVKDFSWAHGKDPVTALRMYSKKPSSYPTYKDCVFSIEAPLSKEESALLGATGKYVYGNVDFEYDYYLEDYEKAIESLGLSELNLPNLYLLLGKEDENAFITRLKDNGRCRAKEYIALIGEEHNTLLIPNRVARTMGAANTFKEFVPFQAEVEFTTDQMTAAADSLRDSSTECNLMRRISESPEDMTRTFTVNREMYSTSGGRKFKRADISYPEVKSYDLFHWMAGMKDSAYPAPTSTELPEGHIFVGPDNKSTMLALSGEAGGLRKTMAFLILTGRIKDILSTANRSMQEVLVGAESHSETILYKIEKHDKVLYDLYEAAMSDEGIEVVAVESEDGEGSASTAINYDAIGDYISQTISESGAPDPIQTIWMANSSDIDIFEYIDTQVKYGKDYSYVVTGYQLVVGTDYFYTTNLSDCKGWDIPLQLDQPQIKFINDIINNSETMSAAYNTVNTYLLSIRYPRLPEYCGGDLHLSTNEEGQRILVCSCGDENINENRKKCIEDLCRKFKHIRNVVSDEELISGSMERRVSDMTRKLSGRTPERIYKDLLSSGDSILDALNTMNEILLNTLEYILDYEFMGLNIKVQDVNGTLSFKVVKDWQFSAQEDPFGRYSPSSNSSETIPGYTEYQNDDPPKKGKGIRDILPYNFDINKDCPKMIDPCEFMFTATTIPSIMVYEVPYFVYAGAMVDTPPVTPGLEIVPYRNINNKLLFNFNTGIGDYYDVPTIIMPSDREQFKKVMRAQGVGSSRKIRFKTDDPAAAFQVFRSETPPLRYTDFSDKMIASVLTDVNPNTIQKADSASHIEEIKTNKKYYYTFRTVDIHGHISNPSPIYEVELVDDDGAVYPIIDIVDIRSYSPDDNVLNKKMMKLIHIVPTIAQGVVNEERSALGDAESALSSGKDISLGMKEQSVWGKKFKVRLVSRKTGRKIDLNINFKTKHVENPDAGCMLETVEALASASQVTTTATTATSVATAPADTPAEMSEPTASPATSRAPMRMGGSSTSGEGY